MRTRDKCNETRETSVFVILCKLVVQLISNYFGPESVVMDVYMKHRVHNSNLAVFTSA
jgi:hypothetical protein